MPRRNTMTSRKPIIVGIAVVVIVLVILAGALWRANAQANPKWTDEALISLFHEHKAQFALLREMAAADMPNSAYVSSFDDDDKLTSDQRQKYKNLMSQIAAKFVMTMDYDTTSRFIFAHGGVSAVGPGWLKGIEYIPGDGERQGKLVQNLDGAAKLPADVYLRPIEPHWFLVYQRTDG
jgi:hypothetical protein